MSFAFNARLIKGTLVAVLAALGAAVAHADEPTTPPVQAEAPIPPGVRWIQNAIHISHLVAYANDNSILMSFLEDQQQPVFAQVYGLYSNTPSQEYKVKINTLNLAAGQRWVNSATDTHWTLFLKLAPIRTTYVTLGEQNMTQYTESIGVGAFLRQRFVNNWLAFALIAGDYQIMQGDAKKFGDYSFATKNSWAKNVMLQGGREFDFPYRNVSVTPMLSFQIAQNNWYQRDGVVSRLGPLVKMDWQVSDGFKVNGELGYNQVFYPESYKAKFDGESGLSTYGEAFARLNLNMMLSARMRMTLHAGYTHDYGYGIDTFSLAVSQYFNW